MRRPAEVTADTFATTITVAIVTSNNGKPGQQKKVKSFGESEL